MFPTGRETLIMLASHGAGIFLPHVARREAEENELEMEGREIQEIFLIAGYRESNWHAFC